MNTKHLLFSLVASIFTISTTLAVAQDKSPSKNIELLGDPAPLSAAQRTIVITPEAKYVSVTGGEIVKFVVGQQSFAWQFDVALTVSALDLNLVAPVGVLTQKIIAYVTPDPMYRNP